MRKILFLVPLFSLLACDAPSQHLASLTLALDGGSDYYSLRLYEGYVDDTLSGKTVFEARCEPKSAGELVLSHIPEGHGFTLVYEGFGDAACDIESRKSLAFRGGISISKDAPTSIYLQLNTLGESSAFIGEIDLSPSLARRVESCDAGLCEEGESCRPSTDGTAWCVPQCESDDFCTAQHPDARCQLSTGACIIKTPRGLNTRDARSFGTAQSLASGDVVFLGGLSYASGQDKLFPMERVAARFNAQTGVFEDESWADELPSPGGDFGALLLEGDLLVTVGGKRQASLDLEAPESSLKVSQKEDLFEGMVAWDFQERRGLWTANGRFTAEASLFPLGERRFWVVGGATFISGKLQASPLTSICEVAEDLSIACEDGPRLQTARRKPAISCVDSDCEKLLVFGGNTSAPLGELWTPKEALSETQALLQEHYFDAILQPSACGLELYGGFEPHSQDAVEQINGFYPVRLRLNGASLEAEALEDFEPIQHAAAPFEPKGQDCWLAGGIDDSGAQPFIKSLLSPAKGWEESASLKTARFGAQAARVGLGPLKGALLITGGIGLKDDDGHFNRGEGRALTGSEIYLP